MCTDWILQTNHARTLLSHQMTPHPPHIPHYWGLRHQTFQVHQIPRSHIAPVSLMEGTNHKCSSQRTTLGSVRPSHCPLSVRYSTWGCLSTISGSRNTPNTLYAINVWSCPTRGRTVQGNPRTTASRHLTKIHWQALTCLSPMRTTTTDILEAHANILPLHLLIDKIRMRALMRLATLPNTHPLQPHLIRAHGKRPKRHLTPLHHHLASFSTVNPKAMETIHPICKDPKATPTVNTHILSSEEARALPPRPVSDITIFTDVSAKEGGVGAAAILTKSTLPACPQKLIYHLGHDTKYTVYSAESTGLLLGAYLLQSEMSHFSLVTFTTDNQAAILAIDQYRPGPSHTILDEFEGIIECIREEQGHLDITLAVQWVPGHQGIQGNEDADQAAKQAAEGASSHAQSLS
jgi:ribonuclease HI